MVTLSRDSLWLLFQAPICEDAPATSTGMCPEIESRSQQQQTKPYITFVLVLQLISDDICRVQPCPSPICRVQPCPLLRSCVQPCPSPRGWVQLCPSLRSCVQLCSLLRGGVLSAVFFQGLEPPAPPRTVCEAFIRDSHPQSPTHSTLPQVIGPQTF